MIGYSIIMGFCSFILVIVGVSLLLGNHASMHGKVYQTTKKKTEYAKATGKPVLFLGVCMELSGNITVLLDHKSAFMIAIFFLVCSVLITIFWLFKVQCRFKQSE